MSETQENKQDAQEEQPKRKRRTRAEMESIRQASAGATTVTKSQVIDAITLLVDGKVDPCVVLDLHNVMHDCAQIKSELGLSDQKFLEILNKFTGGK